MQVEQQREHFLTGFVVQIACGLIPQQQAWLMNQSPRDRYPLLLAARELPRVVLQPMAETNCLQHGESSFPRPGLAGNLKRQTHVSQGREARQQVKGLENNAKVLTSPVGQSIGVHVAQALIADQNFTTGRSLQAGEQQKQGRFPATRGACDCQCFSRGHHEGGIFEYSNLAGLCGVLEKNVGHFNTGGHWRSSGLMNFLLYCVLVNDRHPHKV